MKPRSFFRTGTHHWMIQNLWFLLNSVPYADNENLKSKVHLTGKVECTILTFTSWNNIVYNIFKPCTLYIKIYLQYELFRNMYFF